jgi:tryptophan-rich sensory protein
MLKKNPIPNAFAFLICIAIPIGLGFFASSFTIEAIKTWYTTLNKPSFNPPNWVFAPVWTTLYVLMGVASYRVWYRRKVAEGFNVAVMIYFVQLALNFAWSLIFFEMQQISLALVEMVLLLVSIIFNGFIFYRFDKLAGWLFVPYFLWASFATYLTYSIYMLN